MNFFEHQDRARRNTGLLVFYYILAVILILVAVYGVIIGVFVYTSQPEAGGSVTPDALWNPEVFVLVVGITGLIILSGTVYKVLQMRAGGKVVAQMLGGREIEPGAADPLERKVLNVVEEIAIASGTPVPSVFILDQEDSINAFAAGFSQGDAVVAVTRGCATQLTRDELQGVIAHEFSHILNGDMRLNLRLMGVLHGILVLALVGYWTMRVSMRSGRSSRGKKGNAAGLIALVGLLVMIVGYIGVFFAKLIKSAVSRQREFLADASAVQFTRNPSGIGGALKKIAGYATGSRIKSDNAEQASHLFFCNGLRSSFLGLMATHPPIEERIKRVDPSLFAEMIERPAAVAGPGLAGETSAAVAGQGAAMSFSGDAVMASVGTPNSEHLAYATALIKSLPAAVQEAARDAVGAQAVTYALLLNRSDSAVCERQRAVVREKCSMPVVKAMDRLEQDVGTLGKQHRLVVADMSLPALRKLTESEYRAFEIVLLQLTEADSTIDLFEYTLQRMLRRHLSRALRLSKRSTSGGGIDAFKDSVSVLLSCLAYWGQPKADAAQAAFNQGAVLLPLHQPIEITPRESCGLAGLDAALKDVDAAPAGVKQSVLNSCVATVVADRQVTVEEAEMLRAIADAMDCPIPPLIPGGPVSRN